jgi:protein associated with RNAse G/E
MLVRDQGEVFAEGSTAVRRDTVGGKVWTAAPHRVIRDTGGELAMCCWPGVELVAPTTWIEWLVTGDDAVRKRAVPDLASGRWRLGRWTWRDTTLLSRFRAGELFSVHHYFGAGRRGGWYVNFERPFRRTAIGIDTFDLLLDLVVEPDLSGWTWKDEDEYAHGRRIGLIDDALHSRVDEARQRVLALIEAGEGPFADDWSAWRRDPAWPVPALPPDALDAPVRD